MCRILTIEAKHIKVAKMEAKEIKEAFKANGLKVRAKAYKLANYTSFCVGFYALDAVDDNTSDYCTEFKRVRAEILPLINKVALELGLKDCMRNAFDDLSFNGCAISMYKFKQSI